MSELKGCSVVHHWELVGRFSLVLSHC